jgi:transposase
MGKLKEIIRLNEAGLSIRKIAAALAVSRPVVTQYIIDFKASGLKYKNITNISDTELLELLGKKKTESQKYRELADGFGYFTKELKKKGVTLHTLWEEYIAKYPDGYKYTQFCYHFQIWRQVESVTMHIEHKAGDKCFVDFTGEHMQIVDRQTGEITNVEIFVAILGASQLTYSQAVSSQTKENLITATENAFIYFGGVPAAIVPDALKSAVTNANKWEPDINPQYFNFAEHYGTVVLPARAGHAKDKAMVENAVKIIYQRIFAPLRNRVFHSLTELNVAIFDLLEKHNNTKFTRLNTTRRALFEEIEKDKLRPLAASRYEFKNVCFPTVAFNYHVHLAEDNNYYSVPYRLSGKKVKLTYNVTTVEIFYDNIRVAYHKRCTKPGAYTTNKDHMPASHRYYAEWSPDRISRWASKVGPDVKLLVVKVLEACKHPEQGYRSCIGIINLAKKYGSSRVNNACIMADKYRLYSYKAVKNILDNRLEAEEETLEASLPLHGNIRGSSYYK